MLGDCLETAFVPDTRCTIELVQRVAAMIKRHVGDQGLVPSKFELVLRWRAVVLPTDPKAIEGVAAANPHGGSHRKLLLIHVHVAPNGCGSCAAAGRQRAAAVRCNRMSRRLHRFRNFRKTRSRNSCSLPPRNSRLSQPHISTTANASMKSSPLSSVIFCSNAGKAALPRATI